MLHIVKACLLLLAAVVPGAALASPPVSDQFEMEVYSYETVPSGHLLAEQHANMTAEHGAHLTWELVYGIVDWLEVATYFATEVQSGTHDYDFAEWRFRVRPRGPKSWRIPTSLNIESVFDAQGFASLELRPIVTPPLGWLHLDVAPSVEIERTGSVEIQPALKAAVGCARGLDVGIEYYANLGAADDFSAPDAQWHQLFGAVDVTRWPGVELNFGMGVGLTPATDPFTVKLIVGYLF